MMDAIFNRLETLIAKVLAYDPETSGRLSKLSGKSVRVVVKKIDLDFCFLITDKGVQFSPGTNNNADVTLTGTPLSLLGLLSNKANNRSFPKDLEIKGDINLAQEVQHCLRKLDVDWEEIFSGYIGDTPARKLMRLVVEGRTFVSNTRNRFSGNLSEYLRFESEVLPDDLLVNEFTRGVDELRNDVERLKMRIERLIRQQQVQ